MPAAKNFEMQESTHLPDSDDESGGVDKDEEVLHIWNTWAARMFQIDVADDVHTMMMSMWRWQSSKR